MNYKDILKHTKKKGRYKPYEFENIIGHIFFKYENGNYYLYKDKKRTLILSDSELTGSSNYLKTFEKNIISNFEIISSDTNGIIVTRDNSYNLSIINNYFYLSKYIDKKHLTIKKYKIDSDTYFEYSLIKDKNHIVFGNKKTYSHVFKLYDEYNSFDFFDFYNLFLKVEHSIKNNMKTY